MISIEHLTFDYPGVRALEDISFRLPPGSITALVGPNGAGKTTLLRCLAALEEPLTGTIRLNGVDALEDPRGCHRQVGYLSDFFGLYEELSARQCLLHAAAMHAIPPDRQEQAARHAAELLGIADRLETKAGALSRGLRQRLAIAQAIVHRPAVLLLDEPASGLDPEARHSLATLFRRLRDEGMTLLVSSHILAELEEYSTDMLVLRGGRIVSREAVSGAPRQEAAVWCTVLLAEPVDDLAERVAGIDAVVDIRVEDAWSAGIACADDPGVQHRVLKELMARGLPVRGFAMDRRTMQDAYLATVATTHDREVTL